MRINLTNKYIIPIIFLFLTGCADKHFLTVKKTISQDIKFNSVKVVIIDVDLDDTPFTERVVSINDSRVLKNGTLEVNKKIVLNALTEALSFSGKSVFTIDEYNKIKKDLTAIRPASGYKHSKIHALIKLKISYGIQSGSFESEKVFKFYRRSTTCQYIKNPPKDYEPCHSNINTSRQQIMLDKNAASLIDLWYSGEIYLNDGNDNYYHHKSLEGSELITAPYQDENAMNQNIAAGIGKLISSNVGLLDLSINLQIEDANHSDAIALLKQGKVEDARKILEEDTDSPLFNSATDFYNLGLIYHTYGDTKIASDYYSKAIQIGGYKRIYIDALKNIRVLNEDSTVD